MNGGTAPELTANQAETVLRKQLGSRIWNLHVLMGDGQVVLRGRAINYFAKQLAQHSAMKLIGRAHLVNEIEVRAVALTIDPENSDSA